MDEIRLFGGPWNERIIAVRAGETVMLAPIPERVSYSLTEPLDPIGTAIRTARYDIEKVGVLIDDEPHTWRVGVAQGFPRHRIIDEMNAVLALCCHPWSLVRGTV